MHKFTIFTIVLSIMVMFVVGELVLNDTLKRDDAPAEEVLAMETPEAETVTTPEAELLPESEVTPEAEALPGATASLGSERFTKDLLVSLGVLEPRTDAESFDGLLFGFLDVKAALSGFDVLATAVFDGTQFVGTFYEIPADSETRTFGAYEGLRQAAQLSPTGTINENNSYGEGSFYFNHYTKTGVNFLIVRKGTTVYAFEYNPTYHVSLIRPLIEGL